MYLWSKSNLQFLLLYLDIYPSQQILFSWHKTFIILTCDFFSMQNTVLPRKMHNKCFLKGQVNKELNGLFNTNTALACCDQLITFAFKPFSHDFPAGCIYFIQELDFILAFESRQSYYNEYTANQQNKTHNCPQLG